MNRTVWLAFICLAAVTVLFAVRTGIAARVKPAGTTSPADIGTPSGAYEAPPLAKADRLPIRQFPAPSATAVSPTEVAPVLAPKTTASVAESSKESHEIASWHWHVGSKITKRR